jgi:hypothetical protein
MVRALADLDLALGGLLYSTAFGNGTQQVIWWTNFLGANMLVPSLTFDARA